MEELIKEIIQKKRKCYFISPHFDDAALSCGGLISRLQEHTNVTVITVFTKGSSVRNSLSGKKALRTFGFSSFKELYDKRKAENDNAFEGTRVKLVNLNYSEALIRKKRKLNTIQRLLSKVFPEFSFMYPTYRWHVQKAKIADGDIQNIARISKDIKKIITKKSIVFCPVGIGGHVDHMAVKKAVENVCSPIYWVDQPYAKRLGVVKGEIVKCEMSRKRKMIAAYSSQIIPMFGDEKIPDLNERYIISSEIIPARIGNYSLIKRLNENKKTEYLFGLYRDRSGKKVFAKMLIGNKSQGAYRYLRNEIEAYKYLDKYSKKNQTVAIPRLVKAYEDKSFTALLTEFVEGKQLYQLSRREKKRIISKVFDFLSDIPTKKNKGILNRTAIFWIALLPPLSLIAAIKHPSRALTIFRGFSLFLANIYPFVKGNRVGFVHRDIGNWNIMVGKKIYIYDFQLASLAHPQVEYATSALKFFSEKEVFEHIKHLSEKNSLNPELFRSYGIILGILDLCLSNGGNPECAIKYIQSFIEKDIFSSTLRSINSLKLSVRLLMESPIDFLFTFTLPSDEVVQIQAYNPKAKQIISSLRRQIEQAFPGKKIHTIGSADLAIAGLKDIDIMVECGRENLDISTYKMANLFGQPTKKRRSFSEWVFMHEDYRIELCLIDPRDPKFRNRMRVYMALKNNEKMLSNYENLKRSLDGVNVRVYERKRMDFFNSLAV